MSSDWLNIMVLGWHLQWERRLRPTVTYNPYHKKSGWECGRFKIFTLFAYQAD